MFLEVEEGRQDPDEEVVKVFLIRVISDLPLSWGIRVAWLSTFKVL